MKNIEVLKDLEDKGLLKQLILNGLISSKISTYMHMYYHVDAQLKRKINKKQAVCHTAAFFSVSPRAVYRAIASLR
jgi:hypothetical protein